MKRDGAADRPIPFRDWLQTATGYLGWRPREFWSATVVEYFAAIEGWNRAQRGQSGMPEPMSREEAEEIWAAEDRRVARLKADNG